MNCTLEQAVALCVRCEAVAPRFGFHTGLTGGCLYKTGPRKDMDIVFYKRGLLNALRDEVGFTLDGDHNYVVKTTHGGVTVDLLFPHVEAGEYPEEDAPRSDACTRG